jgi:hypothetical protein
MVEGPACKLWKGQGLFRKIAGATLVDRYDFFDRGGLG